MRTLHQAIVIAAKEWLLLLRNPHGLAVLFFMPAAFILVMSFALKNTLSSAQVPLPLTGWVLEDKGTVATQWSADWIAHHGGTRFADRAQLQQAMRERRVQAGVIVMPQWLDEQGKPRTERVEL